MKNIKIIVIVVLFFIICFCLLIINRKKIKERFSNKNKDDISRWISVGCQGVSYLPYLNTTLSTGNTYDYETAKELMTLCYNVTMSNCPNIGAIPNPNNYDIVDPVFSKISGTKRLICCIFSSPTTKTAIVCFSGTFYLDEWEDDLVYAQVAPTQLKKYHDGMLCHEGFYNLYLEVKNVVRGYSENYSNFFITGHSLGGALATIASFDCSSKKPIVYTFAAPRSLNIIAANGYNILLPNAHRVFNTEDIVPQLPLANIYWFSWSSFNWEITTYQHAGSDVPFTVNMGSDEKNHIESYNEYLPM